jgi:hypothetical protein
MPCACVTLWTVPVTVPLTAPLTLARAPVAAEPDGWFGLPLGTVAGAAPVLWPPPWPGMMFWVAARAADAAAPVADEAGAWFALPLDPAGGGAATLGAATLAAGLLAAGTLAERTLAERTLGAGAA